jgi:pimeloyl-ACP methyl ester carboxylesterase
LQTRRRRIRRAAILLVAAPFAASVAGFLFQRAGLRRDAKRFPPRGLLLSRRGHYLHVVREGDGSPAVVFEAGLAATSLSWARVQPLASATSSTFSYDRAGLGWSQPLRLQPMLDQLLDDLHGVVTWAGGGEPVVLVGHSFGALVLLAYARRFPKCVGGMVLVEPVSLANWAKCSDSDLQRLRMGAALSRRGAWMAEIGVVRAALMLLLHGGQRWSQQIGKRAAGPGSATLERLTGEVSKLPRELWPAIAAHWSRSQSFRAMAGMLEALPVCAVDVGDVTLPAEMPVAILSAASATPDDLRERDSWLAGVIEKEHRVIPETGHWLHLETPGEVAAAIRWCVERAKLRAKD